MEEMEKTSIQILKELTLLKKVITNHISWYVFYWTFVVTATGAIGYGWLAIAHTHSGIWWLLTLGTLLIIWLTILSIIWTFTAWKTLPKLTNLFDEQAQQEYAALVNCSFKLMSFSILALGIFSVVALFIIFMSPWPEASNLISSINNTGK